MAACHIQPDLRSATDVHNPVLYLVFEHYLQSCSLHQQARQQIWPTCVSLKNKLWGSAEDLFLTSKYAALTGERI